MALRKTFKGFTEEQLKSLSWDEFLKLIPSSSRRSLRRMSFQAKKFLEKEKKHDFTKKPLKTHFRQMPIIPDMLGKRFQVYNGNSFVDLTVTLDMVGRRLGEYANPIKLVRHSGPGIGATRGSKSVELK
nr:30S ribosomal protein S19 [uncultured archaeon]